MWDSSCLSLVCSLEHEAAVHILSWRPGLPGVMAILLTGCLVDQQLHVWAEGKAPAWDPPPPSSSNAVDDSGSGGRPRLPSLGLWARIGPFQAAGGAVSWLQWANHGSTRASQHLASRVRHHGLDDGGGGQMLKSVAGSWVLGVQADGSLHLWCLLHQGTTVRPGPPRLPDQVRHSQQGSGSEGVD